MSKRATGKPFALILLVSGLFCLVFITIDLFTMPKGTFYDGIRFISFIFADLVSLVITVLGIFGCFIEFGNQHGKKP